MSFGTVPCANCGTPFKATRARATFCKPACNLAWTKANAALGRRAGDMLLGWRELRGSKDPSDKALAKRIFRELCREADAEITRRRATPMARSNRHLRRRWLAEGTFTMEKADV